MSSDLLLAGEFFATADRFLWHAPTSTAVVADLHLGIEASLARQGLYLPDVHTEPLFRAWESLISRAPRQVVMAGDVFDSSTPDGSAIDKFHRLLDLLPGDCRVTITPGNHDPSLEALGALLNGRAAAIQAMAQVAGFGLFHGHRRTDLAELGENYPRGLIVGHQHPAVTLATRVQSARMICFAIAEIHYPVAKNKMPVILLPSFSRAPLGCNLLNAHHWLLDLPRPGNVAIRIAGIIERGKAGTVPTYSRVLDFGPLSGLV